MGTHIKCLCFIQVKSTTIFWWPPVGPEVEICSVSTACVTGGDDQTLAKSIIAHLYNIP